MRKFALLAFVMMSMAFAPRAAWAQVPNMQVRSNAFPDGGIIPVRFTSHGDNVQPDFTITGAPDGSSMPPAPRWTCRPAPRASR